MAKRKGKNAKSKKSSSTQKGKLVERIVAMMHEGDPQATVRRDVRLPAKHNGKRSRQIDVLLLGYFMGYPTMLAIECKNYGRPVNVGDIGRFRDHLDDVGLSPQQGVLVSASAIGSGALDRAQELGMKVYELSGLTPDRLSEAVHDASQLMIFMVPAYSVIDGSVFSRLMHPSAWMRCSANFALTAFSEVRQKSFKKYCT